MDRKTAIKCLDLQQCGHTQDVDNSQEDPELSCYGFFRGSIVGIQYYTGQVNQREVCLGISPLLQQILSNEGSCQMLSVSTLACRWSIL